MDGTGERTCDPDKDRIQELMAAILMHTQQVESLLKMQSVCAPWWLTELRESLLRLSNVAKPPAKDEDQSGFCEFCPTDGKPCGVCGGANGVKPDYSDEPAEGERDY